MTPKDSIKDIMNSPYGLEKDEKILDAILKIIKYKIGRLIIFDSKIPVGIVSEKDILSFLFKDKLHRNIGEIPVSEIMNDIYYVDEDTSKTKAAKFMIDKRCSSVAIGAAEHFEGIVTKTDLTKYYAEKEQGKNSVADWMSLHYFSVFTKDPLYEVIKTMLGFGISRMMIIDDNKQPSGIVSTGDLFRAILKIETLDEMKKNLGKSQAEEEFWSKYGFFCSQPSGKIMTKSIIKVKANEDLAKACQIMINREINALAVGETNKNVEGIIGKRDVLLALAQTN